MFGRMTKTMVLCACLVFATTVFAAESDIKISEKPVGTAPEVVVTATRSEKDPFDTAKTIDVISSDDIMKRRMSRSIPDALKETPGILVQKTASGHGSPYIRGMTGFRNLFMIDGIRLNNSTFREGPNQYWNTVDQHSIEQLEVVKGQGSVLYGSDAIGGTVNAISKSPSYKDGETTFDGKLHYRFSNAETSHIVRAETSFGKAEKFGFFVGGTVKDFGEVHAGGEVNDMPRTGYDELDLDLKMECFFTPDVKLTTVHQRVAQRDIWRSHKTKYGFEWNDTTVGNELRRSFDQDRILTYMQIEGKKLGAWIDGYKVSLSLHSQDEIKTREKKLSDNRRDIDTVDTDSYGALVQLNSKTSLGSFTYGADFYRDLVDSTYKRYTLNGRRTRTGVQGPVGDDVTYDTLGFFVQDEMSIKDKVELTFGLRHTRVDVKIGDVEDPQSGNDISIDNDWDNLVSSARFVWHIDQQEHWNLFGGVSQGFRAPNLSDLSRLDTARSNEIETPSPDLEPEKYLEFELGIKTRYRNLTGEISYFYTDISDMIVRAPTGNIISGDNEVTKRNAGNGYVHGIELGANWSFHSQWSVFGNFALIYGEVDQFPDSTNRIEREPISRLMPPAGTIGIRWQHEKEDLWIEGLCTMAADQDNLSTSDRSDTQRIPPDGTPGYAVFTIRGGYAINKHCELTAAVENLTDTEYRYHGSGQNEPGVNGIVGVTLSF